MRHFNIVYTAAFNRRHKRVGHLYQGRYKAILIDQESYLLELTRHVHVNPVRVRAHESENIAEQISYLQRYSWSSLLGYLYSQNKQSWVSYDTVLSYVGKRKQYGEFVAEGIRRGYPTPWEKLKGQVVLGDEDFVAQVKRRMRGGGCKREQPAVRSFAAKELKTVLREVARYFELEEEKLSGKRTGHRDERAVCDGVDVSVWRREPGRDWKSIGRS